MGIDQCILWPHAVDRKGYGKRNYKGSMWFAHRAAWDEKIGPIPAGLCVLHICDNPKCINVNHLFLGTQKTNLIDMERKGRRAKGIKINHSNLSEMDIINIRIAYMPYKRGSSQYALAKQYGVSRSTIGDIVTNRTWNHVWVGIRPI
jgi:hypothetical protein